jgi:hypothetical protein
VSKRVVEGGERNQVGGYRHDSVRAVERLLDAVSVVDVDVQVQHTLVVLEQL